MQEIKLKEEEEEEEERRQGHLHEIRIAATCVKQKVGTQGCKGSLVMHWVCWECGCVPMSDMCWFHVEEHARRSNKHGSWLHCGYCGARFGNWDTVASWSSRREAGRMTNSS